MLSHTSKPPIRMFHIHLAVCINSCPGVSQWHESPHSVKNKRLNRDVQGKSARDGAALPRTMSQPARDRLRLSRPSTLQPQFASALSSNEVGHAGSGRPGPDFSLLGGAQELSRWPVLCQASLYSLSRWIQLRSMGAQWRANFFIDGRV